jgi:RNA polymerase sigma-70 factor (ECF subfamily)
MKKTINLSEIYPSHPQDEFVPQTVEVTEEVLAEVEAANNFDDSMRRSNRRNGVYSLDADDGIESSAFEIHSLDPVVILETAKQHGQVYCALHSLPETQQRRLWEHCVKGINQDVIAEAEGVSPAAVSKSIKKAKEAMKKKYLAYVSGEEHCEVEIIIKDSFDWKEFL